MDGLASLATERRFFMLPSSLNSFRLIASVRPIVSRKQSIHSRGLSEGPKVYMPFPEVILIEGDAKSCMVYRYRSDKSFCGDTWHQSLEDAKTQCLYEYGDALGQWSVVPVSVE